MLPVIKEPEQYRVLSAHFSDAVLEHPETFIAISLREMWTYIDWWRVPGGSYYVADQPSGTFRVTSQKGAVLTLEINWPTAVPRVSASLLSGRPGSLAPYSSATLCPS